MCIYLGDQDNLTYSGEEHIFPATIGGMSTLEKDVFLIRQIRFLINLREMTHAHNHVIKMIIYRP